MRNQTVRTYLMPSCARLSRYDRPYPLYQPGHRPLSGADAQALWRVFLTFRRPHLLHLLAGPRIPSSPTSSPPVSTTPTTLEPTSNVPTSVQPAPRGPSASDSGVTSASWTAARTFSPNAWPSAGSPASPTMTHHPAGRAQPATARSRAPRASSTPSRPEPAPRERTTFRTFSGYIVLTPPPISAPNCCISRCGRIGT